MVENLINNKKNDHALNSNTFSRNEYIQLFLGMITLNINRAKDTEIKEIQH